MKISILTINATFSSLWYIFLAKSRNQGYVHLKLDNFSWRHKKLSGTVWVALAGTAQVQPVNKLSYVGERNEPRENARASDEAARGLASPLACLSRVYFSRIGELARRLAQVVDTHRNIVMTRLAERVRCTKFQSSLVNIYFRLLNSKELKHRRRRRQPQRHF